MCGVEFMSRMNKLNVGIFATLALFLAIMPAYSYIDDTELCLKCHEGYEKGYEVLFKHNSLQVTCFDCHSGIGFAENINAKNKRAVEIIGYSIGYYELPNEADVPAKNCLKCHLDYKQLTTASNLDPHVINSSCGSCHTIHEHEFKNEKCGDCHSNAFNTLNSQKSKHQLSCSKCHMTHGSIPSCAECHSNKHGQKYENCMGCHTEAHAPKTIGFELSNAIDACNDCHPDIVDEFGENPNKHMQIDCGFCHLKHGMKPPCTYCHTSHTKGDCMECHIYAHEPMASV